MIQPSILTARASSPQITRGSKWAERHINHIGFTFKGEKTKNKKIKKKDWCFLQLSLGGQSHLKLLLNKIFVQLQANHSVLWHPKGTDTSCPKTPKRKQKGSRLCSPQYSPRSAGKRRRRSRLLWRPHGTVTPDSRPGSGTRAPGRGCSPGHPMSGEKRQNDFLFHFHVLMIIRLPPFKKPA